MKNKTILTTLLIFGAVILSGCTEKSEQTEQISVSKNLITDDEIKAIKISENTENLFKEYSEDINNWKPNNRGGSEYNDTYMQTAEESVNVKEGSKSIRIDYSNNGATWLNPIPRSGVDLVDQGAWKINLSMWKDYNAVSFWLFQPNIETNARVHILLIEAGEGENYSIYEVGKEFDGSITGWSHIVMPFSRFKWTEWSTLHYPFDPSKLNALEISFDSDGPVQFTTYIDGFRPVKIE